MTKVPRDNIDRVQESTHSSGQESKGIFLFLKLKQTASTDSGSLEVESIPMLN